LKRLIDRWFYPLIVLKGKCAKTELSRNLFKVASTRILAYFLLDANEKRLTITMVFDTIKPKSFRHFRGCLKSPV
jgi:hypothetical protein